MLKNIIVAVIGGILLLILFAFVVPGLEKPAIGAPGPGAPIACTADAKMCPDGSYVGRIAPNCEFAPCPME